MATTHNHTYEIVVTSPATADVLVQGGRFFPAFTGARLACSSRDGSFMNPYGVNVGKRLAFTAGGRLVITSRVCSITIIPVSDEMAGGQSSLEPDDEARSR
jgi:hypothetical protein